MNKIFGIGLSFGEDEAGLWKDSDTNIGKPKVRFGIKFSIRVGKVLRPIGRHWEKSYHKERKNPWFGQGLWFVLRIPFAIMPFLSISIGNRGIYLGAKRYECDKEYYKIWCKEEEMGGEYLCPSISIRRNRWFTG